MKKTLKIAAFLALSVAGVPAHPQNRSDDSCFPFLYVKTFVEDKNGMRFLYEGIVYSEESNPIGVMRLYEKAHNKQWILLFHDFQETTMCILAEGAALNQRLR
jgi:hypothetical protein